MTIIPVAELVRRAHEIGAWTYVDAVALAPHHELDVRSLGTDFLVTSAYKWFGPHLGALYGRAEVLDSLPAYKVRPAHDRYETGTQSFEAIAGTGAAVEYLAALGRRSLATLDPAGAGAAVRRQALVAAMSAIRAYELGLLERLISGLRGLPGVRIWGTTDTRRFAAEKAPTVAITFDRMTPREAARALGDAGLFTWDGDFYAQALIERLGLASTGGVLRIGIVHYNTRAEGDRLGEAIEQRERYGTVALG